MIIPIDNSILYVEPIYLKAENENSMPEVKRVVMVYKDQIVMENDVNACLEKIFGVEKERAEQAIKDAAAESNTQTPPATESGAIITLEEAKALYTELEQALEKVNKLIQKIEKETK
jgi:hypothetical protein